MRALAPSHRLPAVENETCRLFRAARGNILCARQSLSMLRSTGFCAAVQSV